MRFPFKSASVLIGESCGTTIACVLPGGPKVWPGSLGYAVATVPVTYALPVESTAIPAPAVPAKLVFAWKNE